MPPDAKRNSPPRSSTPARRRPERRRTSTSGDQRNIDSINRLNASRERRGSSRRTNANVDTIAMLSNRGGQQDRAGLTASESRPGGRSSRGARARADLRAEMLDAQDDTPAWLRALDVLDTPRAAVVATGHQLGLATRNITRGENNEVGFDEWRQEVGDNISVGDVLEQHTPDMPAPLRTALGFAGDVAFDPLTYLAPEAKFARMGVEGAGRGLIEAAARETFLEGGERFTREMADDAILRMTNAKTTAALTPAERAVLGVEGGIYVTAPGTGMIGRRVGADRVVRRLMGEEGRGALQRQVLAPSEGLSRAAIAANAPLRAVRNSRGARALRNAGVLGGENAAVRQGMLDAAAAGDGAAVSEALKLISTRPRSRGVSRAWQREAAQEIEQARDIVTRAGIDGSTARLAVAGDLEAIARVQATSPEAAQALLDVRRWVDEVPQITGERAGRRFIEENPFYETPRITRNEYLEAQGKAKGSGVRNAESVVLARKFNPGQEILGTMLVEPAQHPERWPVMRQIDEAIENARQLGMDAETYYVDDLWESLLGGKGLDGRGRQTGYIERVGRQLEREHLASEFRRVGMGAGADSQKPFNAARMALEPAQRQLEDQLGALTLARKVVDESGVAVDAARESMSTTYRQIVDRFNEILSTPGSLASADAARELAEIHVEAATAARRVADDLRARLDDMDEAAMIAASDLRRILGEDSAALDAANAEIQRMEDLAGDLHDWADLVEESGDAMAARMTEFHQLVDDTAGPLIGQSGDTARALDESIGRTRQRLTNLENEIADWTRGARRTVNDQRLAKLEEAAEELQKAERLYGEAAAYARDAAKAEFPDAAGYPAVIARLEADHAVARAELMTARQSFNSTQQMARRLESNAEAIDRAWRDSMRQFGVDSLLPEHVVEAMTATRKFTADGALGAVLRTFDEVQQMWKAYAILSPGFHWRNFGGGVFNNWLAGLESGRYRQWMRVSSADARGQLDQLAQSEPDLVAAYRAARESGTTGTGQSVSEVAENLGERGGWNPLRPNFRPLRASRYGVRNSAGRLRVPGGEQVENMLRGSLFIDRFLTNGGNVDDAFADVVKFHFDYDDLSDIERNVARRAIPFYTWTRKNVPLMLEQIARQPGKINNYFNAKENLERDIERDAVIPEWMRNAGAIQITDGPTGTHFTPDLPLTSLFELGQSADLRLTADPSELLGMAGNVVAPQLSPLIKTPIEMALGRQVYNDQPFNGELQPVPQAWNMIPGLVPALRSIGRVENSAEGVPMMTDRSAYILEQFMPLFGRARRLYPSEERFEERSLTTWLGFAFGLGVRTNGTRSQMGELYRRKDAIEKRMERAFQLGYTDEPDTDIDIEAVLRDLQNQ